ncbi:MAG: HEPN domain-containing protein [Acidobacteria bacterium]|nr:HEPN domain-containing protein [Acidobacteriota bacterium]
MKEKSDLVRGWIRKAESDLTAMEASAEAGAGDAACFHAQQAAEKYLKAYLADRSSAIPPTHSLLKLIACCAETDASFSQMSDIAEMLTPFAVEVRYDMDFWPSTEAVDRAQDAAVAIREFVSGRLGIPAAQIVSGTLLRAWKTALESFGWKADLKAFKYRTTCPGFFDRVIGPADFGEFERLFRESLHTGKFPRRAAEVAFWKNFRQHKSRDSIAKALLDRLTPNGAAEGLAQAIEILAQAFNWVSFQELREACGQASGFATPLAFLSFYDPAHFPMADRRIGEWWARRFPQEPQFSRRKDGLIQSNQQSWSAYVSWTEFCRRQAEALSNPSDPWRARDVEMAVWSDAAAVLPLA